MPPNRAGTDPEEVDRQTRWAVLREYEDWSEVPMIVLSLVWLVLVVIEFAGAATPLFEVIGTAIWLVFVVDFVLRFVVAPDRIAYLRGSALSAFALLLPALRVFRVARAVRILRLSRTTRSLRLVRLLTSFRRGMRTLTATMQRRGMSYVVALTVLVILLGAAGVFTFENALPSPGFDTYWEALWWTAMLIASLGTTHVPISAEARLLTLLLGLYGLAVFGYITAALASYFVADEAAAQDSELPSRDEIRALRLELAALREELRTRDEAEG